MRIVLATAAVLNTASALAVDAMLDTDYAGVWKTVEASEPLYLEICPDLTFEIYRDEDRTNGWGFRNELGVLSDDLLVLTARHGDEIAQKLVLGGWKSDRTQMIFGTRYVYMDGHIINGVPSSYEKEVDEQSTFCRASRVQAP